MARYLRFLDPHGAGARHGRLDGETVRLLDRSPLDGGTETGETLARAAIREHLPPVEAPNVIAVGANYRDHCRESNAPVPAEPLIFAMLTTTLAAHGQPVRLPRVAPDCVDYEGELVVVIGRTARNVPPEEALAHVFGYTCGNDITARDCQRNRDRQWTRAKGFDTFAPVGPVLATGLDPSDLRIRTRVNGETLQEGTTAEMVFDVAFLVSYVSRAFTLLPGTLLFTGTPAGVGAGRTPPRYLAAGDVVEVEIEGIGTLRNPVEREV